MTTSEQQQTQAIVAAIIFAAKLNAYAANRDFFIDPSYNGCIEDAKYIVEKVCESDKAEG